MSLTAQTILNAVSVLPVTPLRAALIECIGKHAEMDTYEVAEAMGHRDPRKALSDLTKLRRQGYLLNKSELPDGNKGQPRKLWRLSAKGKRTLAKINDALATIQSMRNF